MDARLEPCPFCAGGETVVVPHTFWTGQRSTLLSVEVKHWCNHGGKPFPRSYISVTADTEEQAIEAWNKRAT